MAFEVTAFNPTVKGAELAAEIVDEIVTGAPPHTVYTLRIRRGHRSWVVRVRFSQFETLRNAMQADVGAGAAIPPLPAKVPRLPSWIVVRINLATKSVCKTPLAAGVVSLTPFW